MIQLLLAVYSGFTHAFEADHLLAVSNLVTNRRKTSFAIKDGIYWGLGHTSTILIVGLLMIYLKVQVSEDIFHYFEASVGVLLITLALFRLNKFYKTRLHEHNHHQPHHLAYFVGLVHGLAGSGALIVLVMTQIQSTLEGLLYLGIFGIGSMLGMLVAAGLLSIPFTKDLIGSNRLQVAMILVSCTLCIFFGTMIVHDNLL